ncbi:MAG: heavy metal translocating P-type ATPase [Anaerolineae bacterium]
MSLTVAASPLVESPLKGWQADCCITIEDLDAASDESWAIANRLAVGVMLGMMVMLISLALYTEFVRVELLGLAQQVDSGDLFFFKLVMFLAATPTVALLGWPIARSSWRALHQRRLSSDSLILLGSVSAYVLSVYSLATGGEVYFDTATVILLLVTVGHFLEIRAQIKSSQALQALLEQAPGEATIIREGREIRIAAELVTLGETVIVRPGEAFPVDGEVMQGEGSVNEANITGEARPVFKEKGQPVYSGTVSLDGYFVLRASGVGEDRVIARLIRLLTEARRHRAPIQRLADQAATFFVPSAILLGLLTFLFWSWQVGPEAGLLRGLAVLLIACPCTLGIATPLAIWAGLHRAAVEGILIRHGEALEKLSRVRHFFFDKTGTLTRGTLSFNQIVLDPAVEPALTEAELLVWAAGLESASEHPLGRTIVAEAHRRGLALPAVEQVSISPGLGLQGRLMGLESPLAVGSARLMARLGWPLPDSLQAIKAELEAAGQTVICCGLGGQVQGLIGLTETVRSEAAQMLAALDQAGLLLTVLTGDSHSAGQALAQRLAVPVSSQLLPQDKVAQLKAARQNGRAVAMVGDGLNDAPALAAADVGIALGCGVDVTRETADISLIGEDLGKVVWAWRLAQATYRRIRWNLVWAFFYNSIGVALAMLGLLHPILSALAMVLSNLMVVGNSMSLYRFAETGINEQSSVNNHQ